SRMRISIGDVVAVSEDMTHEFKMHSKIAIEEVPRKCEAKDRGKVVRTMQPASKTISAMLNTQGGKIYLGITDDGVVEGLTMNHSQIDHFYLSLHDTLARFRPAVTPEMVKIRIVELDENRVKRLGNAKVEIPGIKDNRAGKIVLNSVNTLSVASKCKWTLGWLSGKEGIWEGEFDTDQLEMKKMTDDYEDDDFPRKLVDNSNEEIVTEHVVRSFKCVCQQSGYHVFKNYLIVIQVFPSTNGTIYENEEGLTYRRRQGSNKLLNVDQMRMWMDAKPREIESDEGWMGKIMKMMISPFTRIR
ncbi:hypothetical protein PMAYCL1PPCAC_24061, partial [Pristionchus mayeri]